MAVDPDLAVPIYAVELDEHASGRVGGRNGERLSGPPDAARQRAATGALWILLAELPLDAPIMWQLERSPAIIVERYVLAVGQVAQSYPCRMAHDHVFVSVAAIESSGDTTLAHDDDAVAQLEYFGELRRDE